MALRTGNILMGLFKRSTQWKEWTDESLAKFKQELLEIAGDVISVCEKYDLDYVLAYGSALGAVRHRGFVPWDDDFDINMPRKDFNYFLEICDKELGDKYYIRGVMRGNHIAIPTLHIRKKNTKYINYGDLIKMSNEPNEMQGIYIDIAVFENAPDNKYLRLLDGIFNLGIQFITSCIDIKESVIYLKKVGVVFTTEERNALRLKYFIGLIFGVIPVYKWYCFYNWYASKNTNNNSQYVCSYAGYKDLKKSTFERNKLFPAIKGTFEGNEWKIPCDFDYYLKTIYNDYNKLPPVEYRKVHPVFELHFSDGTKL